jgi:hypothetical protein
LAKSQYKYPLLAKLRIRDLAKSQYKYPLLAKLRIRDLAKSNLFYTFATKLYEYGSDYWTKTGTEVTQLVP